jgi:hypothetical protein
MAALAVVPKPTLTLYALSEELMAHLDSIDLTDPGSSERAECEAAIQAYLAQLPAKVDSVARMLAHLESQAQMAAREMQRLTMRKQTFERATERLEEYCVRVLEQLPAPRKGPRKLEGETSTLTLRPSDAVVLRDEASVPADYKTACVEMPAPVWEDLVRLDPTVISQLTRQNLKVRLADIKKALRAGESVAGADIEYRNHLVRK